jgi:hypothetical protein
VGVFGGIEYEEEVEVEESEISSGKKGKRNIHVPEQRKPSCRFLIEWRVVSGILLWFIFEEAI